MTEEATTARVDLTRAELEAVRQCIRHADSEWLRSARKAGRPLDGGGPLSTAQHKIVAALASPTPQEQEQARVERVDLEWAFRLMRDCLQAGKEPEDDEQDRLDDIADAMIRPAQTEQGGDPEDVKRLAAKRNQLRREVEEWDQWFSRSANRRRQVGAADPPRHERDAKQREAKLLTRVLAALDPNGEHHDSSSPNR